MSQSHFMGGGFDFCMLLDPYWIFLQMPKTHSFLLVQDMDKFRAVPMDVSMGAPWYISIDVSTGLSINIFRDFLSDVDRSMDAQGPHQGSTKLIQRTHGFQ